MLLDTCFLIDLQREFRSNASGRATAFLHKHAQTPFALSVISVLEFLEGFADPRKGEALLQGYAIHDVSYRVSQEAARIRRQLRLAGQLIGDFDILIAATACCENVPLVTEDRDHFGRVAGLAVIAY